MSEFADFDLDINLTDVQAFGGGGGGPSVPPGVYSLTVLDIEQKSSRSGNPTLRVTFEVADEGQFQKARLVKSYSLQPQALGRLKQLMLAAGASLDRVRASELLGATIEATVVHTEMAGQPQPDGTISAGRVMADVTQEKPLAGAEAPPPPPPPVTKAAKPAAKAAPVAARRA